MSLNLYLIKRTGADQEAELDAAREMVLAAADEDQARNIAAAAAHDEGRQVWLQARYATITRLGVADKATLEGVILIDVREC